MKNQCQKGNEKVMYRRESEGWFKHYDFVLLDMICLQVSFMVACLLRGYGLWPYESFLYRNMAILLELVDVIVLFLFQTLKGVLKKGHYQNFVITIRHVLIVGASAVMYLFLIQRGQQYSRLVFVMHMVLYLISTYIVREWRKASLRKKMEDGGERSLLIITRKDLAEEVVTNMKKHNYARYKLAGIALMDSYQTGQEIQGIPVVANAERAATYVCQEWIDEVLVVPGDEPYPGRYMKHLEKTGVTIHRNLTQIIWKTGKKQCVGKIGNYTVLTTSINYASPFQILLKRLMDITGGIVGCVITGIIFLFIAPAIYRSSPGPIFFSQERVGKNGKKFKMYKFRSMKMNAEEEKEKLMKHNKMGNGRMFKLDFDPRVIGNEILPDGTTKTGIGDFIRRTSLDEFPQFFNVLKGDMSIVGTRPPLKDEVDLYEIHHRARLAIKPGITGLWQVSGRSDITDFEEVVRMDKEYIANWNIILDLRILVKTVLVILKGDGAM